ncbi:hypothetical protein F5I97DRAFT_921257 [Phlebopus sp. FC_14]|nr:hypothetical protein F5I97DRAFT_921257 [Phlebopus sp. FC_14]
MPEDTPRSHSPDLDHDSDLESHAEQDTQGPSRPGRKKNPNSQAARRDQNRIAQREFRLRKQQRIRDLEARVELLSGSQDQALTDLRAILKGVSLLTCALSLFHLRVADLMAENLTLRNLLKNLAGFIGEGAGGVIPKLGFELHEFTAYLNKAETDTAWESFQARRNAQKTSHSSNAMSSVLGPQSATKRPSEDDIGSNRTKKARGLSGDSTADRHDGYPLLVPMSTTVPPPPPPPASSLYPSAARSPPQNIFSDLTRNGHANSPVFMPPTPSSATGQYSTPSASSSYSSYLPHMGIGVDQGINSLPYPSHKNGSIPAQQRVLSGGAPSEEPDDEEIAELRDPKKMEAFKLIMYHLDNYMRNNAYCLPSSLRPSVVQRTINHESVIDRIVYPDLRDRIILLRGRFSLADCIFDYKKAVKLHGDDVLAHSNWELAEWWLRKYSFLVEEATLDICNRWRRERGETELKLTDIGAQSESPPS